MHRDFDNVLSALNFIDSLPKRDREKSRLSQTLIEAEYDSKGRITFGLYEWHVKY